MHSILSVSGTQAATRETNSASNVVESSSTGDAKIETEKQSSRFSDVMESAVEEEAVSEAEQQSSDEVAAEDSSVQEESLDADSALDEANDLALEDAESLDAPESGLDELLSEPLLENEIIDALGVSTGDDEGSEKASFAVVEQADRQLIVASDVEAEATQNALNPILAQIETAKKMDTQITEVKTNIVAEGSETALKTAQKWFEESGKASKPGAENTLGDETSAVQEESSEMLLQPTKKLDNLSAASKSESVQPIATNTSANHELLSSGSLGATATDKTATDKVTAQVQVANNRASLQSTIAQATLLQQPVELLSKQVSAVMGERIMMMVNQGKHEVTIRLDPAELGSMHIKLQVQQDQLQVAIHTQAAQSRDIIEQNLPRLREQLAQQGINLGDANVQQQNQQQQSQSQAQNGQGDKIAGQQAMHGVDPSLEEQGEWLNTQIPIPAQGIDYYA